MGYFQTSALLVGLAAVNGVAFFTPIATTDRSTEAAISKPISVSETNDRPPQRSTTTIVDTPTIIDTDEVTRRPLFNPARRPAIELPLEDDKTKTGKVTQRVQPIPAGLTLVGIIVRSDGEHLALIRKDGDDVARPLATNSRIDTWKIADMNSGEIVLEQGSIRCTLQVGKPVIEKGPCAVRQPEHSQPQPRE